MTATQRINERHDAIPGAAAHGRRSGMTTNAPLVATQANRRDALMALGTLFAMALGWHGLVSDAAADEPVILDRLDRDGVPDPSAPMLLAQLGTTFGLS